MAEVERGSAESTPQESNRTRTALRRPGRVVWLFIGVVLAVAATLAWQRVAETRALKELSQGAHEIQIAVERYAVDTEGWSYPHEIEQVIKDGFLAQWPDNPFGPGRMKPLRPGDPWEPGGFVYAPKAESEPEGYVLAFYAPRGRLDLRREQYDDAMRNVRNYPEYTQLQHQIYSEFHETPGIDWDQTWVLLTSGGIYITHQD